MNIQDLVSANLTPKEISEAIKAVNASQENSNTARWIKEFEGEHKILKKADRYTDSGERIPLNKTVINYQQAIINLAVAFLFGNPIDLILNEPTDKTSKDFTKFKQLWKESKTDGFLYNFAEKVLVQSRAAGEILKDTDNVRQILIDAKSDVDFFINKDDNGKADAFEHTYIVNAYDVATKKLKEVVRTDLFYLDNRVVFDEVGKDFNILNGSEESNIEKMPIIYAEIVQSEFEPVSAMIDRLEKIINRNADSNDYFTEPILIVDGQLKDVTIKKGSSGNVMTVNKKSSDGPTKIEYLTWVRASKSYEVEVEFLIDNTFFITGTPRLDFKELSKTGALSGVALKLMFLATTIKTKRHIQKTFDEVVGRLISIKKSVLSSLPIYKDNNFNNLDISWKFNDGLPVNLKEQMETLKIGVDAKAMSKETAIENNSLVNNSIAEVEQIKKELTEESEILLGGGSVV